MNQYVVAYVSLFLNEIEMEQVLADNEVQAIRNSRFMTGVADINGMDMLAIKSYFFDCDSLISVICLKHIS